MSPGAAGADAPTIRQIGWFHWRGVATLVRREVGRTLRWPEITVIAPVFSALVFFIVFRYALGAGDLAGAARQTIDFIIPGLIIFAALERAFETPSVSLIYDKYEGAIVDVLIPPLKAWEFALGYALAGMLTGLITGSAVLIGASLIWPIEFAAPLAVLGFAVLTTLLVAACGTILGILGNKWDHLEAALSFGLIPVAYLSGIFAPIDELPDPLAAIMTGNPLYYAIDGFRGALGGSVSAEPATALAVVAGALAALWAAAYMLLLSGTGLRD